MKKLSILTLSFLFTFNLFSQTIATTEDGRKVLLNSDGTWKYEQVTTTNTSNVSTTGSYSCDDLIQTTEDKMTGKKTVSTKKDIIISKDGKNGIAMLLMNGQKNIIMSMVAISKGSGCIDENAKINFLFRDGTKLEMASRADFNCKGNATLYFGKSFRTNDELNLLKTKEVEAIRVWTRKSYVQEDLTLENSKLLMNSMSCLSGRL